MQFNNQYLPLKVAALAVSLALSACGGGGGSSGSIGGDSGSGNGNVSPSLEVVLMAGDSLVIPGNISTKDNLLTSVKWSVSAQTPTADTLVLSNDTCGVVTKNDTKYVPVPGANASTNTGASNWTCELGVVAPAQVTKETLYKLILTGTNDKGNITTIEKMLRVKPNPNYIPSTNNSAGIDFNIASGSVAPLNCAGGDTNSYQWVITNNGGLPLDLSNYNTAKTSFTAPVVKAETKTTFTCRVTDVNKKVQSSSVNVTIKPAAAGVLTLNTKIAKTVVGTPGKNVTIDGLINWYDANGVVTTGPLIAYKWTLGANTPAGITLLSDNAASTQLAIDPTIKTAIYVPVTLTATSNGQESVSTTSVLIDPLATITPVISPSAVVVKVGEATQFKATSGTNLYYQWTQVSGVPVIIGGASTDTAGFVAPAAHGSNIVLRVAIGYAPITVDYPGVYFIDATAQID